LVCRVSSSLVSSYLFLLALPSLSYTFFPYTTLFRSSTDENYSLSPLSRGEIWAASYSGIPSHCIWLASVRRRRYGSRRYRHTGADVGYTGAVARLGCSEPRERVAGTAVRRT